MNSERESKIEKAIKEFAERFGWLCWKFVSPGLKGVPDRMFIKGGRVVFIEVKKFGEEPTRQQEKRGEELRAAGVEAYWVDTLEDARVILEG